MARARLPHCCDNDDDEDEVSREIGFDLTDAGIQEHKVSGFNSDCFIFKLSYCSNFGRGWYPLLTTAEVRTYFKIFCNGYQYLLRKSCKISAT